MTTDEIKQEILRMRQAALDARNQIRRGMHKVTQHEITGKKIAEYYTGQEVALVRILQFIEEGERRS